MQADHDAYCLTNSRQIDPRWKIPVRPVEPDPQSRMFDPDNPDCPARPPDDPAAATWMRDPRCRTIAYYDRIPESVAIEDSRWMDSLPRNDQGQIEMDRQMAVTLGLIHSRDYQTRVEQVYLGALSLSANRFDFLVQWLGGTSTDFNASGSDFGGSSTLSHTQRLGVSRSLSAGGQIAANLLNSLVWRSGPGGHSISSDLVLSLTQPLLRGACRHVRLENLTQAERSLLYQVRDFAHFRREFYLSITQSYLRLLTQIQALRNQQANLQSLELNLREHQELFSRKMVSQIQVDQVFQQYQSGRIDVYGAEQNLANAFDAFKIQLGLPPQVELKLDEQLLKRFELASPEVEQLGSDIEALYQELVQFLPPEVPSHEDVARWTEKVVQFSQRIAELRPQIEDEFDQWEAKLDKGPPPTASQETRIDLEQQQSIVRQLKLALTDLDKELSADETDRPHWVEDVGQMPLDEAWNWLSRHIGAQLRDQADTLFTVQNQVRLFQIDVVPLDLDFDAGVQLAYDQRLDLMNEKAQVFDAFRKVEVAANALQSNLNLQSSITLGTEPGKDNPLRFDASANQYQVGLEFDGPLNRFNERNAYRATQIAYQQSRREFMSAHDRAANQIRSDLRELRVNALNFQISRQQLIAAIRQVEEAQFNLRTATEPNSNLTRDLLQALQGLLGAKNNLISNWIQYEIGRIQLFVDLDALKLDDRGVWLNETENLGAGDGNSDSSVEPVDRPKLSPSRVAPDTSSPDTQLTPSASAP